MTQYYWLIKSICRIQRPMQGLTHPTGSCMKDQVQYVGRLLVIFDGRCGLCNRVVRWLIARDRRDRLRFVPAESEKGAALLGRHGLSATELGPSTILVIQDQDSAAEKRLLRSDAVVALLKELPAPWPAVGALLAWVPRPVRELGYRLVARWRYSLWGRLESCPIPTGEERKWFL